MQTISEDRTSEIKLDWYWISGRHPDYKERKKGTSCLGVCIVEAAGAHHANARAQQLGIHPGGEFKIWLLHGAPPARYQHRLLKPEEAREANIAIEEMAS